MKTFLKIVLWVLIGITAGLVGWAVKTGGSDVAISWNLMWGYALLVIAVLGVLCSAIISTFSNFGGIKKTIIALVAVVAVVGAAVALALNNELVPIPNSAGGVFDDPFELKISGAGLYVTYFVAAVAIIVVVFDVLSGLVRRVIK